MDLVAGLHWLRENLPSFNGDGNKITVMGHGTGAALANILAVSPVASGKFRMGVCISCFLCVVYLRVVISLWPWTINAPVVV